MYKKQEFVEWYFVGAGEQIKVNTIRAHEIIVHDDE